MSLGLQLNQSTSFIPLSVQAVDSYVNNVALQLKKTKDYGCLQLESLLLNPRKKVKKAPIRKMKFLVLLLVLLGHAALFAFVMGSEMQPVQVEKSAAPMMVSIIAPPAPIPAPEPELVPVVAPVKQVKKPVVKPKKIVKKIVPVVEPDRPMVEAVAEPEVEEAQIEEEEAAPVAAAVEEMASEPVVVEQKIEPPKFGVSYLNNPAPSYPRLSRRAGEEGRVLLKVLVTAKGRAETVNIEKSSGFNRLDSAAIKAVKKWRFVPARKGSQALSAYVLVPVKFSLGS